jgi:hypothetical protein
MAGLEIWQKILVKCEMNEGSDLQPWWNWLEKVNAKKIELIPPLFS